MTELRFGFLVAEGSDPRARRLAWLIALEQRFDPLLVDDAGTRSVGGLRAVARQVA